MIGSIINGRYEIVAELGEGGMAAVFEASDLRLQREVAIKILHPHIAKHDEFCRRFHQEAAIAARLVHPNIVQIYDYGTSEDGRTFIVSELIRGKDFHLLQVAQLKENGKPFSPIFCALVCEEILKALEVAHRQNFIHRDVKPDNVMIAEDGTVKLTDFGIAKNIGSELTVAGHFLGSPVYSSPEQVQGDPVDFRSDLFALGIILYEALSGTLPFSGKNASEVMMRIIQGSYAPLSQVVPDVPPELESLVDRALAVDREKRFASTSAMRDALRKFLDLCGIENSRSGLEAFFQSPELFLARHERTFAERLQRTTPTPVPNPPPQEVPVKIELASALDPRKTSIGKKPAQPQRPPSGRRTAPTKRSAAVSRTKTQPRMNRSLVMALLVALSLVTGVGGFFLWDTLPANLRKQTLSRIAPQAASVPTPIAELPPIAISQTTPADIALPTPKPTAEAPRPTPTPSPPEPRRMAQKPPRRRDEPRFALVTTPRPTQTESTPQPVRATTGRVSLQTIPAGANLIVDGRPAGSSGTDGQPRVLELKAGAHTIAIAPTELAGVRYGGLERRIVVEPGKVLSLGALRLTPFRALTLSIAGPGVVVRVNGDPYPLSGKSLTLNLPEGRVEIRAKATNGKTFERVINLKGDNLTLNASLE